MQQTKKPVSKVKMILMWVVFVGITLCWIALLLWRHRGEAAPAEPAPGLGQAIITMIFGAFFLVAGIAGYAVFLATNCFTFNFQKPIWSDVKGKLYVANVVVLTGISLGIGFGLAPFLSPLLTPLGVTGQMGTLVPVLAMIVIFQVVRVFVLIWTPLEKNLIAKRLQARGLVPAQLQAATLVGISNPLKSSFKKITLVEDDIGALWVGPEQLVYWGDNEQFAITRDQVTQIERKADAGGTTMLGGVTHLILHLAPPGGGERQIRFHPEGHWTMASQGRAMDALEQSIVQWHSQ
jgi:hypothetical protein